MTGEQHRLTEPLVLCVHCIVICITAFDYHFGILDFLVMYPLRLFCAVSFSKLLNYIFILRNVCQRNNQMPSIDIEQTKQWQNNDIQNITQKTKFEQHEPH